MCAQRILHKTARLFEQASKTDGFSVLQRRENKHAVCIYSVDSLKKFSYGGYSMFQHILLAADGSAHSVRATEHAIGLINHK